MVVPDATVTEDSIPVAPHEKGARPERHLHLVGLGVQDVRARRKLGLVVLFRKDLHRHGRKHRRGHWDSPTGCSGNSLTSSMVLPFGARNTGCLNLSTMWVLARLPVTFSTTLTA